MVIVVVGRVGVSVGCWVLLWGVGGVGVGACVCFVVGLVLVLGSVLVWCWVRELVSVLVLVLFVGVGVAYVQCCEPNGSTKPVKRLLFHPGNTSTYDKSP